MSKWKTAKSLGMKKGDCVITENGFPAIIIAHANTSTPMLECFGAYHECGSAYAERLKVIGKTEFLDLVVRFNHSNAKPVSKLAKDALKELKK